MGPQPGRSKSASSTATQLMRHAAMKCCSSFHTTFNAALNTTIIGSDVRHCYGFAHPITTRNVGWALMDTLLWTIQTQGAL